jgi:hypothetical protein
MHRLVDETTRANREDEGRGGRAKPIGREVDEIDTLELQLNAKGCALRG